MTKKYDGNTGIFSEKGEKTALIRIIIPVGLTFLLFTLSVFFLFIPSMEKQMMDQKRELIYHLTDTVWSFISQYDQDVKKGKLSLEDAQNHVIGRLNGMRYGSDMKDYFWINDMHHIMVMHPYRPDLVGKDLTEFKDPNGKMLFAEFVKKVQQEGAGYVDYMWQWKDSPDIIVPKLSYVKGFEPWGWVIGTGVYVEDVYEEIGIIKKRLLLLSGGIFILIFALSFFVVREAVRSEKNRRIVEKDLMKSERKLMELYGESKRSEELYSSLIRSSADAIVLYDMNGYAQYVSPAFTHIFGWTHKEVVGKRIPFLPKSEEEKTISIILDLVKNGTPCRGFQTKRYTKDGRTLNISISASRYTDHEGKPEGMLVILRDISEIRDLEERFQQAQKMESIGTLAGGVAHDFNNLLMAIQGNTSLLLMGKSREHPDHVYLKKIEKCVADGANLTRQLLGFARGGKYVVETTDINDLLSSNIDLFGSTKKEISITSEYEPDLMASDVDKGQIEQVLMNIFVNAAHAMPEGGELFVKTQNAALSAEFTVPYNAQPGNYVKISIGDTGTGIGAEILKRIFDPFFTTKEVGRGTGLGLASAYGIVRNHEGFITVESEIGKGTEFCIYLPAVTAAKPVPKAGPKNENILVRGEGTILLVDDEEIIREVGVPILEAFGYEAIVAKNGEEALETYHLNAGRIDLVILDMIMPDMHGSEVFDKLKEMNPHVKVLLASGYSIDGPASEIMARGCSGFIQKPFIPSKLSRLLKEILEQ